MRYDHIVVHDGVLYRAGEDVPDDHVVEAPKPCRTYTEEDLADMSVKAIKRLAESRGITIKKTVRADVIRAFIDAQ